MVPNRNQSQGEVRPVAVRPLVRLARSASVKGVLDDLAEIVAEKGIDLYSIRVVRAGLDREFRPAETVATAERVSELEVGVEGGHTQLILKLCEASDDAIKFEIEDAVHLAAHRIELLAESRLRPKRVGKGRELSPVIEGLIGDSEPMHRLKDAIVTAARCTSTVLIGGESGTGKELAARAIHSLSNRAKAPFVPVNCGAFAESLLESELFGYVKGAFTGATANRRGLFEAASGGTIFLDEIGETAPVTQVRLLRVLQEHKIRPVGAHDEREVDVRVIAATNRDLSREVSEKRFRHDLYYRLHVLPILMPPLRTHSADLPLLAQHFLDLIQARLGFMSRPVIEDEALDLLCRYRWPGNVRELEAMLERLAAETGDAGVITAAQVRRETAAEETGMSGDIEYRAVLRAGESLDDHLIRQELALYQMVRDRAGGNHSQAARRLGVERTALYHRLERARQRVIE
jgi:two-component system response regulator PilR (NtrC family)